MIRETRVLSEEMENDFLNGKLKPLLEVIWRDRDLILEFRGKYATIYCKGHRLDIQRRGEGYEISADAKFLKTKSQVQSATQAASFVEEELPRVKQAIAVHPGGAEIEFEQALIRANNMEPNLNTDYFAVDRQVLLAEGLKRIDVLGIHWPGSKRGFDQAVALALIEVKYALSGGVEDIADQVLGYYATLEANIEDVAKEAQALLRQKLRLGLITGASEEALKKLEGRPVSKEPKRVKIVLALVDYSPRSTRLAVEKLRDLGSQVQIFHLGFGLWEKYAQDVPVSSAATA